MTEQQIQSAVFAWSRQPKVRERYPELKLLFHIKNEERGATARTVAIDRAGGVKKGVPDLCLLVARDRFHALYIELKTEKGRASPEQKWWQEELTAQGNYATVCRGWEAAAGTLTWYLSLGDAP